jgi:hypothetical protein
VAPSEASRADSAFAVHVGEPPFGRIAACADGSGLCVVDALGKSSSLAPGGREPIGWGADSVGYLEGPELVVRPVGPGRTRRARLPARLGNAREFTAFLGKRAGQDEP